MSLEANLNNMYDFSLNEIKRKFNINASIAARGKSFIKFGRNPNVGATKATVQQFLGSETEETYVNTNIIDTIVTDDAGFTGTIAIEGQQISGTDFTFTQQNVVLNGMNPVPLSLPLARVTRAYSLDQTLAASTSYYIFQNGPTTGGVPDVPSTVHLLVEASFGQSQKCSTSVSKDELVLLTKLYGAILRGGSAQADINLETRQIGTPWRTIFSVPVSTNGSDWVEINAPPIVVIGPNSDLRLSATSSSANTMIVGAIAGYFALNGDMYGF